MACYYPKTGYRSRSGPGPGGKWPLVGDTIKGYAHLPVKIPCGYCIGCRLAKSREWAVRIMHEAEQYEHNCYLTLTYEDSWLPKDMSIKLKDVQLFMKRLRQYVHRQARRRLREKPEHVLTESEKPIRFFACGEYGDETKRPHYHLCVFNVDFADKILHSRSNGNKLYVSDTLAKKIWKKGNCYIGNLEFQSAAYVARYIMKKMGGKKAKEKYEVVDTETGEVFEKKKEFVTMSTKPGIGFEWFSKFERDVYIDDKVYVKRGLVVRPPRYYDKLRERGNPEEFKKLKERRLKKALEYTDNSDDRLAVKAFCQQRRLDKLIRKTN